MKRRTILLAGLGGLAVPVGAWLLLPEPLAPQRLAERPALVQPLPPAPQLSPSAHLLPLPTSATMRDATVELCGMGRLPLRWGDSEADAFANLPAPVGRLALRELHERLQRALAAGDARQRVAGWLLSQPDSADASVQAAWASGLLVQARAGGDAQALRWAAAACGLTDDAASCRRDLARARVQVEPGNALHWLEWAQEASGDAEQDEAWQGLVRAQQWHEHAGGLTAVTQAVFSTAQPVPAYLRAELARETLGRDAALAPGGLDWLEQQCTRHREDCARVAEHLLASADSAALLAQAAVLGRQLGWPDERVQAVTAATQNFHARLPRWADAPQLAQGCDAAIAPLAHAQAVGRDGEMSGAP